jgi:hypothetical protein
MSRKAVWNYPEGFYRGRVNGTDGLFVKAGDVAVCLDTLKVFDYDLPADLRPVLVNISTESDDNETRTSTTRP